MFPVFDGHNDFLSRLLRCDDRHGLWPGDRAEGHLDLPRMRRSGFVGGFFAIWVPDIKEPGAPSFDELTKGPSYDVPLPPPVALDRAQSVALTEVGLLRWMERASDGAFRICTTGAELRAAIAAGQVAAIMHMEGAEAIGPDLDALHVLYDAGLRSLGPVWSRPTIFGDGVPFRFPGTPDTGPGLTDLGKALVRECDALGVLIDLSHITEKGFDDVAATSDQPLMATHSNAHALSPTPRNLTDRQLAMIAERDGIVGLNFAAAFLNADGQAHPDTSLDIMLGHLDHLLTHLGETRVALGSDFDGARIPSAIGDVTGVQSLCQAMLDHGFGRDLVQAVASENWLRFLDRTLA